MKILVLRFSSIGDIVLTTPVVRQLKTQLPGLACRPCSKIGFAKCPQGHFKCMRDQDLNLNLPPFG